MKEHFRILQISTWYDYVVNYCPPHTQLALTEGVEVEIYPTSLTLPSESEPQDIKLITVPQEPGLLDIKGAARMMKDGSQYDAQGCVSGRKVDARRIQVYSCLKHRQQPPPPHKAGVASIVVNQP